MSWTQTTMGNFTYWTNTDTGEVTMNNPQSSTTVSDVIGGSMESLANTETTKQQDQVVDVFGDTTASTVDTATSNDPWASVTQIGTNIESVDPTVMDNYNLTYNTGLTGFAQSELDAAKASGDKGLISLAEQLYGAAQAEDALTKTYGTDTGILTPDAFSPEYQQAAKNYNDYKYMLSVADRYSGIHNSPIFNAALTAATGGAWGVARGLFNTIDAAANGNWEDALKSGALTYVSSQLIDSNAALDAAKATGDAAAINAAQQQLSDAYNLSLATTGASALAEGDYRKAAVAGLQALGMTGDISTKLNEYGVTNETLNKIVTSGVSAAAAGDDPLMAMGTTAASEGFDWLADNVFKSDQPAPVEDKSTQAESTVEINPETGLPYNSPVSSQTGQGDTGALYTKPPEETVGVTSTVDNNVVNVTASFGDTKVELNYPQNENYWDNSAYVYDNETGAKTGWLVKEDGTVVPDPTTGLKLDLDKETGLVLDTERNALILQKADLIEQAMAGQQIDPSLWDSLFGKETGIDYYGGELFSMPSQEIYINFDPTTVTPTETTQPTEVVQQPPTQDTTGGGGGGSEGGMLTGGQTEDTTKPVETASTVDVKQTEEYKAIEQQLQTTNDSKVQLEAEFQTTQNALEAAQQEYDNLLDKTSEEAKNLQEEIDQLELGKESIQNDLDAANGSIKELEGKLSDAQGTISSQQETISSQKDTIATQGETIDKLNESLTSAKADYDAKQAELDTANETLQNTQATLDTTKQELADAQAAYSALQDKSSEEAQALRDTIGELNGNVATLEGQVKEAQQATVDKQAELDAANESITGLQGDLAAEQERVTTLEGELNVAKEDYAKLEANAKEQVAQAKANGESAVAKAKADGEAAVAKAKADGEAAVAQAKADGEAAVKAAESKGKEAVAAAKAAGEQAVKEAEAKAAANAKAAQEAADKALEDAKAAGQAAVDKAVADGKAAAEAAKAEGYASGYGEGETVGYGTGYGEGYGEGKGAGYASGMLAGRGAGRGGRAFSPYSGEIDTQLSRVAYSQPQQAIDYVDQLLARLRA